MTSTTHDCTTSAPTNPAENLVQILNNISDRIEAYADQQDNYVNINMAMKYVTETKLWDPTLDNIDELVRCFNEGPKNRCTKCKVDMGRCNPRQLCGKYRCLDDYD